MMKKLFFPILFIALTFTSCSQKNDKEQDNADSLAITNGVMVDSTFQARADSIAAADTLPPPIPTYIVIDKPKLKLYVIEKGDTLFQAGVCVGRVKGNKRAKDDRRTPEGEFTISDIHDATGWLYHTDDGRWVPHVYGPWFFRLKVPGWTGIGIHGTSSPGSIGYRRSKGCIRMKNEDAKKLHEYAQVGMRVIILPDFPNGVEEKWEPSPAKSQQASSSQKTAAKDSVPVKVPEQVPSAPAEQPTETTKPATPPAETAPAKEHKPDTIH